MATFPFTFPHAGHTFSVVIDGAPAAACRDEGASELAEIYVRIVGIRGLHEFGRTVPGESNDGLQDRICRWYDMTYAGARQRDPGSGLRGPS